jgi:hypothetical protein
LCCFGFGDKVDENLLKALAFHSKGEYYHLNSQEEIGAAFALALRNLISMVARNLEVNLEVYDSNVPCYIQVYSTDGAKRFTLPNLSVSQELGLVFLLTPYHKTLVAPERCPTIKAQLTYTDCEGIYSQKIAILDVKFVKWGIIAPTQDTEVYAKWQIAQGIAAMQQAELLAADEKQEQATDCIFNGINSISGSGYAAHPEVAKTLQEMRLRGEFLKEGEQSGGSYTGSTRTPGRQFEHTDDTFEAIDSSQHEERKE